jgi:hypothetical protein
MPVSVHPDDRFSACQFCKQVFLARPTNDAEFSQPWESAVLKHEGTCPQGKVLKLATANLDENGRMTSWSMTDFTIATG